LFYEGVASRIRLPKETSFKQPVWTSIVPQMEAELVLMAFKRMKLVHEMLSQI
jgi:hypothetical protein